MILEELLKKIYYVEDLDIVLAVTRRVNGGYETSWETLKKTSNGIRMNLLKTEINDKHYAYLKDARVKSVISTYKRIQTYRFGRVIADEVNIETIPSYENQQPNS